MSILKNLTLMLMLFFVASCTSSDEKKTKEVVIPKKITFLFITQPHCPACDHLEESMNLPRPKQLLANYFDVKKVYYGEKLPDGIMPPRGTPTVHFLGANDETLLEAMVGQKEEDELMEYLQDALLEFKNTYHVDLQQKNNEQTTHATTL